MTNIVGSSHELKSRKLWPQNQGRPSFSIFKISQYPVWVFICLVDMSYLGSFDLWLLIRVYLQMERGGPQVHVVSCRRYWWSAKHKDPWTFAISPISISLLSDPLITLLWSNSGSNRQVSHFILRSFSNYSLSSWYLSSACPLRIVLSSYFLHFLLYFLSPLYFCPFGSEWIGC